MFIIDSHCHLNCLDYKSQHTNLDDVISKAIARDVKFILSVATNLQDYFCLKELIGNRRNIALACGIHPLNQDLSYNMEDFYHIMEGEKIIAIGETGLDYHLKQDQNNREKQQNLFRKHIYAGIILNKPIIIHMRQSFNDTIKILREEKIDKCGGLLHCFTEDKQIAAKLLDLGLYISFSGIVTFRNAIQIRDAARYVPLDRLLIETDSPYLSPVPHRGKENQPAFVRDVADYMAKIKNVNIENLASITTENFSRLFKVPMNLLMD